MLAMSVKCRAILDDNVMRNIEDMLKIFVRAQSGGGGKFIGDFRRFKIGAYFKGVKNKLFFTSSFKCGVLLVQLVGCMTINSRIYF